MILGANPLSVCCGSLERAKTPAPRAPGIASPNAYVISTASFNLIYSNSSTRGASSSPLARSQEQRQQRQRHENDTGQLRNLTQPRFLQTLIERLTGLCLACSLVVLPS